MVLKSEFVLSNIKNQLLATLIGMLSLCRTLNISKSKITNRVLVVKLQPMSLYFHTDQELVLIIITN